MDPERTAREVEFVVEKLALEPGARILDLACGHGRHSVELGKRGYRVTGLDLSEPSLELARRAAEEAGVGVEWVHADMRAIPHEDEFDAVINIFTSFGYLETEEEDERVLAGVARALRPDGRFLMETLNPVNLFRRFTPLHWDERDDGSLFLEARSYDLRRGRSEARWVIVRADGERRELVHSLRLYTYPELAAMLARAGLEIEADWGGSDGSELDEDTRRIVVLARRRTL